MLSYAHFHHYKKLGYTHIPLIAKQLMDNQTPVTVFAKLKDHYKHAYLFESVVGGERFARYSMIGLGGEFWLSYQNGVLSVYDQGEKTHHKTCQPLAWVKEFMTRFVVPTDNEIKNLPRFSGGLVGYFGYDLIRTIEPSVGAGCVNNPLDMADLWLTLSTQVVVFDNLEHTLSFVVYADTSDPNGYDSACLQLKNLQNLLTKDADLTVKTADVPTFISQTGQDKFCADVQKIKDYILAGDVMQVVPAQRLSAPFTCDSLAFYRALRYLNPSPYLFMVQGGDFELVGASPEILARIENGRVTVRPLAGTRRRGRTDEEDLALEQELLSDPKEIAEHVMLIDLGRNDIGKVCETGSVTVAQKMFIERYSQVMHIASHVEGQIKEGVSALDVFCATFPAGTLSGAPKVRAMQIIDECEPVRRTVFGGAVGYLGFDGNMDTAIAIRTAVVKDGQVHIQAGAGVVADSDPIAEWEETNKKAVALIKAVELACAGLVLE